MFDGRHLSLGRRAGDGTDDETPGSTDTGEEDGDEEGGDEEDGGKEDLTNQDDEEDGGEEEIVG